MSAVEDGLVDALTAIQAGRAALAKGDLQIALLHLVFANRYHAAAVIGHHLVQQLHVVAPLANAAEVDEKLHALQREFIEIAAPARAPIAAVVNACAEGLRPILRELAMAGADPDGVVTARARNTAAILLGHFDIRTINHERT